MRVGINATCFNQRPSGAKQRFLGIYRVLFRLLPDVEFVLYEPKDCRVADWFPEQPNLRVRVTPIPSSTGRFGKFVAGLTYWPNAFKRDQLDLFEAMHLPLVRPKSATTILTIHDVRGIEIGHSFVQQILFTAVLSKALKRADRVVTVSATMRDEILDFYPLIPVSVVYNGIDTTLFDTITPVACAEVAQLHRLPTNFLLAVGHFEQRKNYSVLIEALALLKARGQSLSLVIIGNDSGGLTAVRSQVDDLGLSAQVHLLTGLTDHEVRCVYLLSSLFVFPSLYEGFGIPILEAMAAQRPMLLSDLPVFREITQNKAIYFPPQDPAALAESIATVLTSSDICTTMVRYGQQRVHDFSFHRVAQDLAAVYERYQTCR